MFRFLMKLWRGQFVFLAFVLPSVMEKWELTAPICDSDENHQVPLLGFTQKAMVYHLKEKKKKEEEARVYEDD